jgi:hypothetical protein
VNTDPEEERQLSEDEPTPEEIAAMQDALTAANSDVTSTELVEVSETQEGTAAAKLMDTLRALSSPDEDAGELQLMLATVAMGLERSLGAELQRTQETGELDDFLGGLTRWIATHRSDTTRRLVVVELPRRELSAHRRLLLLDEAERLAAQASSPL